MYTWQLSLEILTLKTFENFYSFVNSNGNNSIKVGLNPILVKYLDINNIDISPVFMREKEPHFGI